MIDLHRYCFSCMGELQERDGICPFCGHDNRLRTNGVGYLPCCILEDRYIIGRALGRGGFGVTYLGLDSRLDRKVAVKEFFPTDLAARETETLKIHPFGERKEEFERGIKRVIREAKIAARMEDIPNVVRTYELLETNGTVYLVMEYVEGITLAQHIRQGGGKLPWIQAWPLLKPVMAALGKVHRKGIVHRDVSPDNIMIRFTDGSPVLLDFGAAQAATTGATEHSVNLKMGYAPLEQYSTMGQQDGRSDMYSMMATLYCTLTGKQPASPLNVATGIEKVIPPSELGSDIPEEAEEVLLKGMSTRIEDRYGSMEELVEAFEEAGRNGRTMVGDVLPGSNTVPKKETVPPVPKETVSKQTKKEKKKGKGWIAVAAILLITLIGIMFWKQGSGPAKKAELSVAGAVNSEKEEKTEGAGKTPEPEEEETETEDEPETGVVPEPEESDMLEEEKPAEEETEHGTPTLEPEEGDTSEAPKLEQEETKTPESVIPALIGTVTITGKAVPGGQLKAELNGTNIVDQSAVHYTWIISGLGREETAGTGSSYLIKTEDADKEIWVKVSVRDMEGELLSKAVHIEKEKLLGSATVTGTSEPGEVLYAECRGINVKDKSLIHYTWIASKPGEAETVGTGNSYTVRAEDIYKDIYVIVTADGMNGRLGSARVKVDEKNSEKE